MVTAEVEATARGQVMTLQSPPELELNTDRHLILSALGNLIQNAMKYTKAKGSIAIVARAQGTLLEVEISDQCGGIPADKLEHMFMPFTQCGPDRSGLGLGLTIARQAVANCGGTITAKNIPGGCAMLVSLPRYTGHPGFNPSVV